MPLLKGHALLPSPVPSDALAGSLGILLAGEPVHLLVNGSEIKKEEEVR